MGNEWLSELKAGDQVIAKERYRARITKVLRLTKTQILIAGYFGNSEIRFRKDDGYMIGEHDRFGRSNLVQATKESIAKITLESSISKCSDLTMNFNKFTQEQCDEFLAKYAPPKEPSNDK